MALSKRSTPPDVLIVQPDGRVDHLVGVADHLARRGLSLHRQNEPEQTPRVAEGTRVVVVTDVLDPRCVRALRMARRVGARTLLVMDGLVEYRNTFHNPRVGDSFLRPAPVDLVCCSGLNDVRLLHAMGNHATATGLPRIDESFRSAMSALREGPVLVATANTPAFNDEERATLLQALDELRRASQWSKTRLIWRLTDGLEDELGVTNHPGSLWEALSDSAAVVTTPSTLQIEAMRAGRPTAILHPYATPLWQPGAWVWASSQGTSLPDPIDAPSMTRGLSRYVDSPERLLRQLGRPTREQMERQQECLTLLDASSSEVDASELVAEAILGLARSSGSHPAPGALRPVARLATRRPRRANRKRIVSVVPFDHSPIGGVTTWSRRLSDVLERRGDLGYDLHTLLVSAHAPMAHSARPMLDERTSLCVLDRTDDHFVTLANLRRSIEMLEPDVVLPNYSDASYAVATQLRYTGVPSVAIAHTDCAYYRDLLKMYPDWDGAVSVSDSIDAWLKPEAGNRPFDRIVYSVPASSGPRQASDVEPVRIAYVGRIEQEQKRVMDLVPLVHKLAALGVEAELHIVGEGRLRQKLRQQLSTTGCVRTIMHGPKSPEWVERFWTNMDIAVLVSEYEGTSITMLEAMGQGVVPAVTRVASGVGDWITEGVTGVTAPVGEPEALAAKIAALAWDRPKLAAIGQAAWQKVRAELSLDRMAERYASIFDRVLATKPVTRPSLSGTKLAHWSKMCTEDVAGEVSWLQTRLAEAGYASMAVGEPDTDSDVVIIPGDAPGPTQRELESWRRRGIDTVFSALLPSGGVLPAQLRALADEGFQRIAVFGLGLHTRRFADLFETGKASVVGFIDDHPPREGEVFGLPATTVDEAIERLRPDVVLLSSDLWEAKLWERSRPLREAGIPVRAIYATFEDKPVQTRMLQTT